MKLLSSLRRPGARLASLVALFIITICNGSMRAHAACGVLDGARHSAVKLPYLFPGENDLQFFNPTVVGLWKAVYTNSADNSVFNDSFKSWHADGTEVESAFLSPAGGNVCMGVWKQTDFRTFKLHHTGWLFNSATPTATATNYFTVDEIITVAPHGKTYTGTFTFKVWTLDGEATPVEVKGTIAATRITV
jgi:uncharacterized protein (DUF2147 family)